MAMKAIGVREAGGPEVLELGEVETPTAGPGEVLIKVVAAGINRADLMQRQGFYPPPPGAPEIIGLECSGHIAELGTGVMGWQVGDPCVALLAGGGYAEYVSVPSGQVIQPPADVDLVTAAGLLEVAATVVSNLDQVGLISGETFLVHGGSGGIGTFAIQYAKSLGAQVIATAGSEDKLEHCRTVGADLAVSYRTDWVAAAKDFTAGAGVSVILDNMGASYLETNMDALARGGRLVIIGFQGGRTGTLNLGQLMSKNALVTSTSLRFRPVAEKATIVGRVASEVWPLVSTGPIKPAPETRLPLADAARAHALLESGDNLGKILLVT